MEVRTVKPCKSRAGRSLHTPAQRLERLERLDSIFWSRPMARGWSWRGLRETQINQWSPRAGPEAGTRGEQRGERPGVPQQQSQAPRGQADTEFPALGTALAPLRDSEHPRGSCKHILLPSVPGVFGVAMQRPEK